MLLCQKLLTKIEGTLPVDCKLEFPGHVYGIPLTDIFLLGL
jgi:hypothetical protein